MTGEVLPCRDHAVILQAVNECDTHPRGELWILSVRARIDDWIVRVVVDVEHRSVGDMNSECAPFQCGETPLLISERGVTSCADGHLGREDDRATEIYRIGDEVTAPGAKSGPCLQISPKKKGHLAHRLERIQLGRHFSWRAHRYCEAADFFLLDVVGQSAPLR